MKLKPKLTESSDITLRKPVESTPIELQPMPMSESMEQEHVTNWLGTEFKMRVEHDVGSVMEKETKNSEEGLLEPNLCRASSEEETSSTYNLK